MSAKVRLVALTVLALFTTKCLLLPFSDDEKHEGFLARRARQLRSRRRLQLGPGFNNSNPHPKWCPSATCSNSPMCGPCNRRFLFIIATGRSGSTSLLRMINALPNMRLSGENNNILLGLKETTDYLKPPFYFGENYGPFGHEHVQRADITCPVQRTIESITPPNLQQQFALAKGEYDDSSMIIGFKTIRFPMFWPDDDSALDFILEFFPCSRFLINIDSNIKRQSKSAFHFYEKDSLEELQGANRRLLEMATKLGPDKAHMINLSEWGHNATVINQMVSWMGYRGCELQRVTHEHDSSKGKGSYARDENEINFGQACHLENADVGM